MRSDSSDLTSRALIREAALRLFAEHGSERVTLRQIAAAAGVSHGLVVHHFGSKEGLRAMTDTYVADLFDEMLAEAVGAQGQDPYRLEGADSLVAAIVDHLPPDSPIPAYLRRMLVEDVTAGRALFARLYEASRQALGALAAAGHAEPGSDPDVRAAFLLANDLAVLLLRDHLRAVLGVDPLSAEGVGRWGREVLAVYAEGLRGTGPQEQS